MVQVAMCTDDAHHVTVDIIKDLIIGNRSHLDEVQRMHLLDLRLLMDLDAVQPDPHVHDDDLFSYSYGGHVPAYFLVAADRDDTYISHLNYTFYIKQASAGRRPSS
jgi:hypothetical protein